MNASAQWYLLNSGTSLNLNSVYFLNKDFGWACGDSGIVLSTIDGGDSWSQIITSNLVNLRAIVFVDSLHGIVVGSDCSIYKTSNGGESWSLKNINPEINLNDVKFISPTKALIVGDNGKMLLSSDQGNNWQDISDQYQEDLLNISLLNENYGWVSGDYCFKITTDEGNSWTFRSSNNDGNRVFIYNASLMYKMGWTHLPPPGYEPLMHIEKSTDLGNSWTPQNAPHNIGYWKSIFFCSSQIGYILKDFGFLYTTNQGTDWSENSFLNNNMNSIYFIDSTTGWVVGTDGWILKTTNGGGIFTYVKNEEKILVKGFSLSQNYPNPFNPITTIKYSIGDVTSPAGNSIYLVQLKFFDVLGNEIATLVNKEQPTGNYSIVFNGSSLATGVYFYRLSAGNFIKTNKLILMK